MASTARTPPATPPPSISSIVSTLKAYSVPLIFFAVSLYFQLVVTPRSFPTSHYDVLGIRRFSSIEEVTEAYEKLTSKWDSGAEVPTTEAFLKARYAFELLTNELWKRDYDVFDIDEQQDVIEKAKERYAGASVSGIKTPLLEPAFFDSEEHAFDVIRTENFLSSFENGKALIIQVFSYGSNRCAKFANNWKRIVTLMDGVASIGMVDVGDLNLAAYLAEKKSSGQPFFRNGLPMILAFPPGCNSSRCLNRYTGELSVDAVTDWVASTILTLPRIMYYSKESLAQNFLAKSKPHKVKVIVFSMTGERATPFMRQAAKDYWTYASFAFILWREEESSLWWNMFGLESAPAIVFLKDPGVKPVVYHGFINNSLFIDIMEKNKHHVLPQLRSMTSMDLGCDARGRSLAGKDVRVWYCVILAGRLSQDLNKMRETLRRVQETLSNDGESDHVDPDNMSSAAAFALKQKRLTFTWLDGEVQQKYCSFHINSEHSHESCGPRRGIEDVAQLLIVRYERNATDDEIGTEKQPKNFFEAVNYVKPDPASQLVAKYKGSGEISEIIKWLSKTIEDGDSRNLPPFKTKTPELVPEDDAIWSAGSKTLLSSGKELKLRISNFVYKMHDLLSDPRIGPFLLLVALMLFGRVWLQRSQSTQKENSNSASQPSDKRQRTRRPPRNELFPPSMTDVEPKDAQQVQFSDSDSD
ncbi:hypothetical protein M9H77_05028 [Catharanthus roseus]|uniref:Uncharacterized protein n=1 Tax=Catharanthus roseus TaxID=4058 RepID=A0ACC0CFW2_CATRO|nr:hypothetical protein M9H77_05028 [Catharanthus roseus]